MPEAERERPAAHVTAPQVTEPPMTDGAVPQSSGEWLEVLRTGKIEIEGRLPWSSNFSFLVAVSCGDTSVRAVYKPGRGERLLWDFGGELYRREVAAYELSAALGLGLVPETVLRVDAPYEEGSLQRFVDADFEQHYFTLLDDPVHDGALRELAGFDLLLNNADRKGGHVLLDFAGSIWGIDNGLCFHCEPKLRTVMWDFAGETVPGRVVEAACALADDVPEQVCALIEPAEVQALERRARALVRRPRFPAPGPDHRAYPWPLV